MRIYKITMKNYRCFEDISFDFPNYYTAICGKNDAGKSTIIRALRQTIAQMGSYTDMFSFRHRVIADYDDDFTSWRKSEKGTEPIELALVLLVHSQNDEVLYRYLNEYLLGLEDTTPLPTDASLEVTVSFRYNPDGAPPDVTITIGTESFNGPKATRVVKELKSDYPILFHNSTAISEYNYWNTRLGEFLETFAPDETRALSRRRNTLQRGVGDIVKKIEDEIRPLIVRLSDLPRLSLRAAEIPVESMPLTFSFGERDFSHALEEWGSGTRNRTLTLMTMFTASKVKQVSASVDKVTPIVLIEEPESYLHSSAQAEFGRILQDLAKELEIQVIVSTHSPFMLSHEDPTANLLLARKTTSNRRLRASTLVETSGDSWKEPFVHALGISGADYAPLKELFFGSQDCVILCEGGTDKAYLELLRRPEHGDRALKFEGRIHVLDGIDQVNVGLLKFVSGMPAQFVITCDLDRAGDIKTKCEQADLQIGVHLLKVGKNEPGMRRIEGLIPQPIRDAVANENTDLVDQLQSDDKRERKSAGDRLKTLYFEKFEATARPRTEDYEDFYKLADKIMKAISKQKI